jgi:transposase-like protein
VVKLKKSEDNLLSEDGRHRRMSRKRKRHTEETKARVALEAIEGVRAPSDRSSAYGARPAAIARWKRRLPQGAAEAFRRGDLARSGEEIGRPKVEIDWPQKKL